MISERKKIIFSVSFIVVITFISFLSSLDNGFTNWDDPVNVTENLLIRGLSWNNIKGIFTTYTDYYRPLVFITYAIEYSLFGLEPAVYHTTNLLFHTLNTLLVFWLIYLLSNQTFVALISALLFGVHPLHVESVAWVTERKDVLFTLFYLQAIVYYLLYKERSKGYYYYYLSIFTFILSLLSKPMAVTLPLVLVLCDYLLCRDIKRSLFEKSPFLILSVLFGIITTLLAQHSGGAIRFSESPGILKNLLLACWGITFYLFKTMVPYNLSALYPYPTVINFFTPTYFIPPFIVILLIIFLYYSSRWTNVLIFGSLFFFVSILPVLQLIPIGNAAAADRYMYIPSIGLLYIVGFAFYKIYMWEGFFIKTRKIVVVLFLCIVVLSFAVLTFQRSRVWKNSNTLWSSVLKLYPSSPIAHVNLGNAYTKEGRLEEAFAEYTATIKSDPNNEKAYNGLGLVYLYSHQLDKAIIVFKTALSLQPDMGEGHYNLGTAYLEQGNLDNAIASFQVALKYIRKAPQITSIHNNLGNAYARKGLWDNAAREYKEALRVSPNHQNSLRNLDIVLKRMYLPEL